MPMFSRLLAAPALALSLALIAPAPVMADASGAKLETSVAAATLKKGKQTQAGLYVTAAEAAAILGAREDVLMIDVRTPEETILVGHATAADANIPFALFDPKHKYNAKKGAYEMKINPAFISATKTYLAGRDPAAVLVICRSGGRSAKAVNALSKAGIDLPLYTVVDGFEGDKNKAGKRDVNGWKKSGADWSYKARAGFLLGAD